VPRLVKGGKWTYGWVAIGPEGQMTIPPEAWREFRFQAGGRAVLTPGSRRSGGFSISTPELMVEVSERLKGATIRVLARGWFAEGRQVTVPPEVGVQLGDRLLAVRGSRYGLGFVAQGPIYEEALKHRELEVFQERAT
jgi:hypothetical protein